MPSKGRKAESFRRRNPARDAKHRILIVCEGLVTEPGYFNAFRDDAKNDRVHVRAEPAGAVPLTVVTKAVELKKQGDRDARHEQDENRRWDEVWAVFDVDEHPHLPEARQMAQNAGISLAVSNPSFELWALLHFQDQQAHIERDKAASALRGHLSGYGKLLDYEKLRSGYTSARERALRLAQLAREHGSEGRNPTTDVYLVTEAISRRDR